MCGICGVVSCKDSVDKNSAASAVREMMAVQERRGPDDEGIWQNADDRSASVVFGHNRLAIIDLSKAGHQPMEFRVPRKSASSQCQSASCWITFNGEIYNFLELRDGLKKKGYKFRTETDTEVILVLYDTYQTKAFEMLRGMFAFGLWDAGKQKLFLVRDHFGIKPLYYWVGKNVVAFASTVKALTRSNIIPPHPNTEALTQFLLLGSIPEPYTTHADIFMLPAGHYLEWHNGTHKLAKYYDLLDVFKRRASTTSFEEATHRTRQLLEDSVRAHLISDAPLGVFLSGGLDSSALAVLTASRYADQRGFKRGLTRISPRLITLSVDFEEKEFSERLWQDTVVRAIGSDHHRIIVRKKDFDDSVEEIFDAMDQPTIDGVNTFFIAWAAKKTGLKTVLSGLGGDELFLGYPHFRRILWMRALARLPRAAKFFLRAGEIAGDRYAKLVYLAKSNSWFSSYLTLRGLFTPSDVAKILKSSEREVWDVIQKTEQQHGEEERRLLALDPVSALSYLEMTRYMRNQLLRDTDVMAMHHSVEVRVPFIDREVVEFIAPLPTDVKLAHRKAQIKTANGKWQVASGAKPISKPLLATAVENLLPQEIFSRSKMGFTFPFQAWLGQIAKSGKRFAISDLRLAKTHWSRQWALEVLARHREV